MDPKREQWLKLVAAKRAADATNERGPQIALGQRAESVLNHPGWQTFADALTTRLTDLKASRETQLRYIAESNDLGDELAKMKLHLRGLDGEIRGLTLALDAMPAAVAQGQQAAGTESA